MVVVTVVCHRYPEHLVSIVDKVCKGHRMSKHLKGMAHKVYKGLNSSHRQQRTRQVSRLGNPAMQGVQQGPGIQGPAMQGVQQGQQNAQGMPQGPAWFGAQWIPQQQQQGFANSTTGCVSGAGTTGCVSGAGCNTTGFVPGVGTTGCVPGACGTTGCVPGAGFGTTGGCVPGASFNTTGGCVPGVGTTGCVPGACTERLPPRPGFSNLGMNPENGPVPGAFLGGVDSSSSSSARDLSDAGRSERRTVAVCATADAGQVCYPAAT